MQVVSGHTEDGAVYVSYLKQAYRFAQHSPDPSTQVGCVIVQPSMGVIAGAANTLPDGIALNADKLTGMKDVYMEHAERNALYKCSRGVLSTNGCHAYITLAPCYECARGLIQAGIVKVVAHKEMYDAYIHNVGASHRAKHIQHGCDMLAEAGIEVVLWSGRVFQIPTLSVKVRGVSWTP